MAIKKKAKKKAGKAASRKSAQKKPVRKILKKKTSPKKAAKKKTGKKKPRTGKTPSRRKPAAPAKPLMVEPGPPPRVIPPVEEPAAHEEALGTVTHYYSHLNVAIVQINTGALRTGDRVHIKGHTTDLSQVVESIEYEHQHVDEASPGQSVGIKVAAHVREHDIVYRVK